MAVKAYSASSYKTLKTAYEDAWKKEDERKKDFFKAIFEPVTAIPTRPCPPAPPTTAVSWISPQLSTVSGTYYAW
jgi:hypothetical protein